MTIKAGIHARETSKNGTETRQGHHDGMRDKGKLVLLKKTARKQRPEA